MLSTKAKAIKTLFDHHNITKAQLKTAVVKAYITEAEYKEICGEDYVA